jgi:hypothetical protein
LVCRRRAGGLDSPGAHARPAAKPMRTANSNPVGSSRGAPAPLEQDRGD